MKQSNVVPDMAPCEWPTLWILLTFLQPHQSSCATSDHEPIQQLHWPTWVLFLLLISNGNGPYLLVSKVWWTMKSVCSIYYFKTLKVNPFLRYDIENCLCSHLTISLFVQIRQACFVWLCRDQSCGSQMFHVCHEVCESHLY